MNVHTERSPLVETSDLALLRSMQNAISWESREAAARAIAGASRARTARGGDGPAQLAELREKGICSVPLAIPPSHCEAVRDYFLGAPCHAAHVPAHGDGITYPVKVAATRSHYGSYRLEQSLAAPHVIELALDPMVIDLAGEYLGCAPSLYSINTFWTFPREGAGLTHQFHRDEDDFRFLVVFVYWSPVEIGEGEFYFLEGTHDHRTVERRIRASPWPRVLRLLGKTSALSAEELRRLNNGPGYGCDYLYGKLFGRDSRCVQGPAGTVIASDTFGLHRGALPRSRPRLCTWLRFGLYPNEAYRTDGTVPAPASRLRGRIGDDDATRHITRLVLDWTR